MTFGSLFSGIGGIDLGLERAGMECRWQVENDPYCLKILAKHWPEVKRYGDIRKLSGSELEPVDLICGGFPCQDLSQAGKRAGIEGSRSGLWFEFARLVGELGPRWVLIENVPGLLIHDAIRRVIGELARCGYVGCYRSLRAADFGASHLRKRVFIVAYRENERTSTPINEWTQHQPDHRRRISGRTGTNGENLADGSGRGLGELRQPSGRDRFVDGRNTELENAGCTERRRNAEPSDLDGQWPSDHDSGASGTLADTGNRQLPQPGWRSPERDGPGSTGTVLPDAGSTGLPDTESTSVPGSRRKSERGTAPELCGAPLANTSSLQSEQFPRKGAESRETEDTGAHSGSSGCGIGVFAPGPADPRWPDILAARPDLAPALESPLRRVADGFPGWLDGAMRNRTKRLGGLGNAVVPDCAEWIGRRILELED